MRRVLLITVLAACTEAKRAPPPPRGPEAFTLRCDVADVPQPARDATPMCHVPAGTFEMGTRDREAAPGAADPRRVQISRAFRVDQLEVTNEAFARFLRATSNRCGDAACYETPVLGGLETTSGMYRVVAPDTGRRPAIVRKTAAAAYCAWAGKRLPTDAEWEYLARHDPATGTDRRFVWGEGDVPGAANVMFAIDPERGVVAEVGSFPRDRSAIGAYDLGGNAYEWVQDCFRLGFVCRGVPCVDPVNLDDCETICAQNDRSVCWRAETLRGGGYLDGPTASPTAARTGVPTISTNGFRCVR